MSGLAGVQLHLVDSMDDVAAFQRWLSEHHDVIAVDTETEGLEWWHQKVRLIQVGDRNTGWAFPWQLWGGPAVEAIRKYTGDITMHNAKFDVHMIEHWSKDLHLPVTFDRTRLHDTRVMAHILDPNRATGLKFLASVFVDSQSANASRVLTEKMDANKWTWATVPITLPEYWAYGALDTVLTCRLHEVLYHDVQSDAPAAYGLEMASSWVCERMERNGCKLDHDWTVVKRDAFLRYADDAAAWILANYGCKAGSDVEIIKRLQADGIQFTKMTKSGSRHSLDREVLEDIIAMQHHPLAEIVLQRRRLVKLVSTYFENFLRLEYNGYIHPTYNTLKDEDSGYGARTGRQSVVEPALQTLPRKDNSSPQAISVRNCITASPGRTLIMCDFDQIEARVFTHFANDPGLMSAFSQGDFFSNMARAILGDPTIVKGDPRRQMTKNAMYAKLYGAGVPKFAKTAGATLEQADAFMTQLDNVYPGIRTFQREVEAAAQQRLTGEGVAYIRSPITQRRHVADAGRMYTLVNYLIQGTAAEVLKMKNLELAQAGLEEYMILNVHDEVISDVPTEYVDDAANVIGQVMQETSMFKVPLTVSVEKAFRWGEKAS
jgi:DNA polymerase-1